MSRQLDIQTAIQKALRYISSAQLPDGSFESGSSSRQRPFRAVYSYRTTFVPSLVVSALSQVPEATDIRNQASAFLLKQPSEQWSFNYWAADSPERKTLLYPDDLDDTFCALIALWRHNPGLVDAATLARVVKILVATEVKPGGPYRTWLVPATSNPVWLDVDVAVNANIAYFLQLIGSPLPSLQEYLQTAIAANKLASPYYPSEFPTAYYLAHTASGPSCQLLAERLLSSQKDGRWKTPLQTALAMSTLACMRSRPHLRISLDYLLASQRANGSWPAEAFCTDPHRDGATHYHGSAALTTALAVEAIHLYSQSRRQKSTPVRKAVDPNTARLAKLVRQRVQRQLNALDDDLRHVSLQYLQSFLAKDTSTEVMLLPYFCAAALDTPLPDDDKLMLLGSANLFGWIAYTIYDDFLDDEGDPLLLSVANVCLRQSVACFQRAWPDKTFQEFVSDTFDTIDAANTWEVRHCRADIQDGLLQFGALPKYGMRGKLAERSLGHSLTPIAVMLIAGHSLGDTDTAKLQNALKHYLIARQINDDLHDWERDVRAGHISFVVSAILRDITLRPGAHDIERLVDRMQRRFWNHTVVQLCGIVREHVTSARQELPSALRQPNAFTKLLDKIESSMDTTLAKQAEARQFLQTYRKS